MAEFGNISDISVLTFLEQIIHHVTIGVEDSDATWHVVLADAVKPPWPLRGGKLRLTPCRAAQNGADEIYNFEESTNANISH